MQQFISVILIFCLFAQSAFSVICSDQFNSADERIIESLDLNAKKAMRKLMKPTDEAKDELYKWILGLEKRMQNQKPTALEDLTLQLMLRTKVFTELGADEKVMELFQLSRITLTGKWGEVDKPLPKSVLKNLSRENKKIYELAYTLDAETLRVKEHWVKTAFGKIFPIGLLAITLSQVGSPILGGMAFGYFMVILGDYVAHRFILHAKPEHRAIIQKFDLFKGFVKASVEHYWHHLVLFPGMKPEQYALRFKNDMSDSKVREELIPMLEKAGMTKEEQESFIVESYQGVFVSRKIQAAAMIGLGLITGSIGWAIGGDGAHILAPIAAAVSLIYTPFINLNHMPLHDLKTKPINEPSMLMEFYLNTAFYRAIARRHYMHHLRANSNYAVMPFGLDRLIGTYVPPSLKDFLDMAEADLIF